MALKLREAKRIALLHFGPGWIAVDGNMDIYHYAHHPWKGSVGTWGGPIRCADVNFVGTYTGGKKWAKTLRRV